MKNKKSQAKSRSIKFDPRDFIRPPYHICPSCRQKEFGVLSIRNNTYDRRCRNCFNTSTYHLPDITKKVVLIDQFAISNMMKSINPDMKAHKKGDLDPYWKGLFGILDELCKKQVLICPSTSIHDDESLTTPFYKQLKRMYDQLSHGNSFHHPDTIKTNQVLEHAEFWIQNKLSNYPPPIKRDQALTDKIDQWQERIIITVDSGNPSVWVDDLNKERTARHSLLEKIFDGWRESGVTDFAHWYKIESDAYGQEVLNNWDRHYSHLRAVMAGTIKAGPFDLFPPHSVVLIKSIEALFKRNGVSAEKSLRKVREYFLSDLTEIPYVKISSMLYAALARKAAAGQKKPPNRGTANDFELVSTTLPYVDAMFIDNGCRGLMIEEPIISELGFDAKVFSQNTKTDFMDYLLDIRDNVPESHQVKLKEVYGEDWAKPFETMYTQRS